MTYIDEAILDLTEWLCRRFQQLTGRTSVWLAVQLTNLSIVVYFAWAGLYVWTNDVPARIAVAVFCAAVLYALTRTIFRDSIEVHELNAYRRVAQGLRNPRRVRDALLRILFVTLSLLLVGPLLLVSTTRRFPIVLPSYMLIVLTTVVLYLLACDPLPPCLGKVAEWLRRFSRSRATAEAAGRRVPETPGASRSLAPRDGSRMRTCTCSSACSSTLPRSGWPRSSSTASPSPAAGA